MHVHVDDGALLVPRFGDANTSFVGYVCSRSESKKKTKHQIARSFFVFLGPKSDQVEDDSMDLVMKIEKIGSRSGAPSERVEITDSGELK